MHSSNKHSKIEKMKFPLHQFLPCILLFLLLSSCGVKQSTYDNAVEQIDRLNSANNDLQIEIQQKDKQLYQLKVVLQNAESQASNNLNLNAAKGKQELEYVKKTIGHIVYHVDNCQSRDDLNSIISELEDVNRKISSSLFFNYH